MRRARDQRRVEVVAGGAGADRRRVLGAQPLDVVADPRQHHVAVVQLAEHLLEVAGAPAGDVRRVAEAEPVASST